MLMEDMGMGATGEGKALVYMGASLNGGGGFVKAEERCVRFDSRCVDLSFRRIEDRL